MIIPEAVRFTKEMGEVCSNKDMLVFAVPSVYVRSAARQASPFIREGQIIVDVSKGIEAETLMTLSEVIRDEVKADVKVVALSGPTHAEEVARDLPGAIVSACEDLAAAEKVQDVFMNSCLRVYTNTDVKGVELCGALKNIIALAAGMSAGLGYGDNAKAALITRGLAEISRLGEKLGCSRDTFAGLAGIVLLSRSNSAQSTVGKGLEFDVITCVVLGGVSVNGGVGRMSGVVAGVLLIGSLTNGMILMDVSEYTQMVVKGIVLAVAVGIDCMSKKRQAT